MMHLNSKIYVAGHLGLVGSAIIRNLKGAGYTNLVYRTHAQLDLINQQQVLDFIVHEAPEYVFLCAAQVGGILANNTYRADFIYNNLQIQSNIIHASYQSGVKKLIFLGSSCIYPKHAQQPMREDCLLTGELEYTNEPYAIAKIAGIKLCESYNIQYDTNYVAVMPTNLYGPNDNFDLGQSHVLPAMIRKLYLAKLLGEKKYAQIANNLGMRAAEDEIHKILSTYGITSQDGQLLVSFWGTGTVYREFLHVDDMADACVFIMNNVDFKNLIHNSQEIKNTHVNIGTGSDVTIKQLAYMISDSIGYCGAIAFDATKPDGTARKLLDVSKLSNLGWRYKVDLVGGIKHTVDWYIKQYE